MGGLVAATVGAAPICPLAEMKDANLQYEAQGEMILPYSGTTEPIHVYFDGVANMSRTEYVTPLSLSLSHTHSLSLTHTRTHAY
jgi:hypothetical protein